VRFKTGHDTSVTDRRTDGQTTTMPIARPLLKYGRLKYVFSMIGLKHTLPN